MLIENAIHSQQVYDPTDDSITAEQELCMERLQGIKRAGNRFKVARKGCNKD